MLRVILFILLSTVYAEQNAVVPLMSRVRDVHYTSKPYLLPCNVCTRAVNEQMNSPSVTASDFEKKAPKACEHAASDKWERHVCVSILTENARRFVKAQRRSESAHRSCFDTYDTECTPYDVTIHCDDIKGRCRAY
jgi:hypothetical protein